MERRLAAIFAADMVGYSRLMEADEDGVLSRQKTLRKQLIDPQVALYRGRIVKTTGDGMLAEFASAQDAVRTCAIPENCRYTFSVVLAWLTQMLRRVRWCEIQDTDPPIPGPHTRATDGFALPAAR